MVLGASGPFCLVSKSQPRPVEYRCTTPNTLMYMLSKFAYALLSSPCSLEDEYILKACPPLTTAAPTRQIQCNAHRPDVVLKRINLQHVISLIRVLPGVGVVLTATLDSLLIATLDSLLPTWHLQGKGPQEASSQQHVQHNRFVWQFSCLIYITSKHLDTLYQVAVSVMDRVVCLDNRR